MVETSIWKLKSLKFHVNSQKKIIPFLGTKYTPELQTPQPTSHYTTPHTQCYVLWLSWRLYDLHITKIETQICDFFESYAFPYASLCLEYYLD